MPSEKLYEKGWRQGTIFKLPLIASTSVWRADPPGVVKRDITHETWVVATQDCNLNRAAVDSNSPTIELRQVHSDQPPNTWGIHSRKFRLDDDGRYVVDDKPAQFIAPRVLAQVADVIATLPNDRVAAFKTWLGNRYDRPAVPSTLVDLARSIAEAIAASTTAELAAMTRDVYITFDEESEPTRFSLFAVLETGADPDEVTVGITEAVLTIPATLGLLDEVRAAEASGTSLELIETAYCADLSQLTWDPEE